MKTAFFYRTVNEYERAEELLRELNNLIRAKKRITHNGLEMYTKHLDKNHKALSNIPKKAPGKKKYIAVIRANKSFIETANIDVPRELMIAGFDLVPRTNSEKKYKGICTTKKIKLQTETELLTIVSVFDKAFGRGTWRISGGPKHMKKILKNMELATNKNALTSPWYNNQFPNGIPVTIKINQEDANIDKYLFKVKLKV